jgi:hypothetical protein
MRPQLPEEIKKKVISLWFSGYGRDEISRLTEKKASTGAVSNIVNKWKEDLGEAEADSLRELAKATKLSPAQYAAGIRISNMLKRIGHDPESDKIEEFLGNACNECMNRGISPEKIALQIEDLASIPGNVRISEVEENRTKMVAEIKALAEQKQGLTNDISTLQAQKAQGEKRLDELFGEETRIERDILLINDSKALLGQFNLTIAEFAQNLKDIIACGGNPKKIVEEFDEFQKYKRDKALIDAKLNETRHGLENTTLRYNQLQNSINNYLRRMSIYEKFERLGVQDTALDLLYNTIMSVSIANGIPFWMAFDKFHGHVRDQYDKLLGFESIIEDAQSKIDSLASKLGKCYDEEFNIIEKEESIHKPRGSGFSVILGDNTFDLI